MILISLENAEWFFKENNSYSIERRLMDYVPTAFYGAVMVVSPALCCCAIKCTGSVCNAIGHHQTKLGRAQHFAISVQSTKG
eukprot:10835-Heterococcus_DN1.PRE.2